MPRGSKSSSSHSKGVRTQATHLAKSMASLSLKTGGSTGGKMMSALAHKKGK